MFVDYLLVQLFKKKSKGYDLWCQKKHIGIKDYMFFLHTVSILLTCSSLAMEECKIYIMFSCKIGLVEKEYLKSVSQVASISSTQKDTAQEQSTHVPILLVFHTVPNLLRVYLHLSQNLSNQSSPLVFH